MANVTGRNWIIPHRQDGNVYMQDYVPVLTLFAIGNVTATGAVGSVTTSVATGLLYTVITSSPVVPSPAQIKSGLDHNGAAPLFKASQQIIATGVQQIPVVGLSGTALKYVYSVHNGNGFDSGIVSTSFTLNIGATYPAYSAVTSGTPQPGWFNLRLVNAQMAGIALEAGATLSQSGPLVPANVATLQLADGWLARVDFVEFGNLVPVQPNPVSNVRVVLNSADALVVPVGTLGGIAAGQGLTMVISTATNLTTTPATQGWTLAGKVEPTDATFPRMYVYGKYAIANEPSISVVHSAGKMTVDVTNWTNVDPVNLFDAVPIFDTTSPLTPSHTITTTPAAAPTRSDCTAVSVLSSNSVPGTYTGAPSGWALLVEGLITSVFWTGIAYKKWLNTASTGTVQWGATETGGTSVAATFFLRNAPSGVTKVGFTVPLLHHSPTLGDTTINLTVDPGAGEGTPIDNSLLKVGRWFQYNGSPIYLIGGDCQYLHANSTWFADPAAILDKFVSYGINKVRIFIDSVDLRSTRRPYSYNAGTSKYDLDTWDATYWTDTKAFIAAAQTKGVIVQVTMGAIYPSDNSGWTNGGTVDRPVQYNKANNINGAFTTDGDGDFSPGWFNPANAEVSTTSSRTIRAYQTRLYDKAIAELGSYPNIYWDVHNEPYAFAQPAAYVTPYLQYWAAYLKARSDRPVSVQYDVDGATSYASSFWDDANIDVLNAHQSAVDPGEISTYLHSAQTHGKILEENESGQLYDFYVRPAEWWLHPETPWTVDATGLNYTTQQMWGLFMAGSHIGWYNLHQNITNWTTQIGPRTKALSDFIKSLTSWSSLSPVDVSGNQYDSLVTAGPAGANHQVMATPGSEYVVYFWGTPAATNVTMSIPTGSYHYTFVNPQTGATISSGDVNSTAGTATITSPATNTWNGTAGLALHVKVN